MARLAVLYTVVCLWLVCTPTLTQPANPIKNVVVLMMENRSFDHMLGWLHLDNAEIDGLDGTQFNQVQAFNTESPKVFVNQNALNVAPDDPKHDFYSTTEEIFGYEKLPFETAQPLMNGFVQNAYLAGHDISNPMSMLTRKPSSAPVLNNLAMEFAVFDRWYCSLPGPVR
jgi:phospholipase C